MSSTITFRGQPFSVGRAVDPRYIEVRTRLSLPVNELRNVQFRDALEQRFQSEAAIQFAMIIEIEFEEDPTLLNDCIEMFRHAGIGVCRSPLEYREAYARYEAVEDHIAITFNFTLKEWNLTFAVLCPGIHPTANGLPEHDTLTRTYLRFATEEALQVLLDKIAPPEGA
jgi:hypothetical protein